MPSPINTRSTPRPPSPSSLNSHAPVKQSPAPVNTTSAGQVARSGPVTPSPTQAKSEYDTKQKPQGTALSPTQTTNPEQQAAYNSRNHTLGYGRKKSFSTPESAPPATGPSSASSNASSSASAQQPGWTIPAAQQSRVNGTLLDSQQHPIPGARVSQHISQGENSSFNAIPGNGACSSIMTNWIAAGKNNQGNPAGAAAEFNSRLGSSSQLVNQQHDYLQKYGQVRPLMNQRDTAAQDKQTAETQLFAHKNTLESKAAQARAQALSPAQQAQYAQLEAQKQTLDPKSSQYAQINQQQNALSSHAINTGLSANEKASLAATQQGFITARQDVMKHHNDKTRLDGEVQNAIATVHNLEDAGLQKISSSSHQMQTPQDFANTVSSQTSQPGIYRIGLRAAGRGHAMGVENLGNGQYKFMDPNSAEFHLDNNNALKHVLAKNAQLNNYHNDAVGFDIHQLQ